MLKDIDFDNIEKSIKIEIMDKSNLFAIIKFLQAYYKLDHLSVNRISLFIFDNLSIHIYLLYTGFILRLYVQFMVYLNLWMIKDMALS